MKVFAVMYQDWDDYEFIGVFASEEIAEKFIAKSIETTFGARADHSKYRDRYHIYQEEVIGE
jgi:hypothetical protein